MNDVFDDPELQAFMKANGIVHRPGMAADLMKELEPLLADEGFDDLEDLDALNAAMARAVERHNMELSTPIGKHRENALEVLRRFADAIAGGDEAAAHDLAEAIPINETKTIAAISHVIGLGTGLLQEWFADADLAPALATAYAPKVYVFPRSAARDLLLTIRDSDHPDPSHALIVRYGGKAALHGVLLAVAGALQAIADAEGSSVKETSRALLAPGAPQRRSVASPPPAPRMSVFGVIGVEQNPPPPPGPRLTLGDRAAIRDFAAWLEGAPGVTADGVTNARKVMRTLFLQARGDGLDLTDPADIPFFVDMVHETIDPGDPAADDVIDMIISSLDDYLHFQLSRDGAQESWEEAHALVEGELLGGLGGADLLSELMAVIEERSAVPDATRAAVLASTRIVEGVRPLLEWIGAGKAVTETGAVKRADIAHVAALIGLALEGSAKSMSPAEQRAFEAGKADPAARIPRKIQTMRESDELTAWWEALQTANLIEVKGVRVRPGETAAEWLDSPQPPLDLAGMFLAHYVALIVTGDGMGEQPLWEELASVELNSRLAGALGVHSGATLDELEIDSEFMCDLARRIATRRMNSLEAMGVLGSTRSGGADEPAEWWVPEGLHADVARGLVIAVSIQVSRLKDGMDESS